MATRVIPPRILKKIRSNTATAARNFPYPTAAAVATPPAVFDNSDPKPSPATAAGVSTAAADEAPATLADGRYSGGDGRAALNLEDSERLFASVPTGRLLRSSAVLHATAVGPMVDLGMAVMRSRVVEREGLVREAVFSAVRRSFFEHFCAGEDAAEAGRKMRALSEAGLRGMLVYGAEDAHDNEGCDYNLQGFLRTADVSRSLPPNSASFLIVKITAICPMRLLERVSDLLRWQQKDPSFILPWKQETLPIFSESSPLYHTQTMPDPLTPEEESDLRLASRRLEQLCQKSVQSNIPLLVDAEHTTVQPAIDYFTYSAGILHNKEHRTPVVFGTLQTYLKDAKERLLLATEAADKMGVPMGFKLVRGAYMSMESKIAESFGCDSPIHDSIQDTHKCYNDCSAFLLDKIANGPGSVVLATHNIESGKLVAAKAYELGMGKVSHKLEFAQLYGMSDALSFGLSNAGFQVSKYMPFGPVDMVMPYLLRRAEENRGLLAASGFDRQLMRKELWRRLRSAIF